MPIVGASILGLDSRCVLNPMFAPCVFETVFVSCFTHNHLNVTDAIMWCSNCATDPMFPECWLVHPG